jgi:hypothetical protein
METTTTLCPPSSTASGTIDLQFSSASAGVITYTSTAGCVFDFAVSGDMATLSNGPVVCSTSASGVTLQISYASYTMISDGHTLTGTIDATATSGGTSCDFTETLSLTR